MDPVVTAAIITAAFKAVPSIFDRFMGTLKERKLRVNKPRLRTASQQTTVQKGRKEILSLRTESPECRIGTNLSEFTFSPVCAGVAD
jgi:hypothetical protein